MYLNCHSWFSFKHGVMRPEALLAEAAKAGVRTLALTDIHCTAGVPDLVRLAEQDFGVRPIAGIEFRRRARVENNQFLVETNQRSLAPEFPAAEAAEAQRALLQMSRNDVYLKRPRFYLPTVAELRQQLREEPTSTAAYAVRATRGFAR